MAPRAEELVDLLARPSSVAVIGASADPRSASARPLDYLTRFGFAGSVVPVNPRHRTVGGLPAVPSLSEVEFGTVDVALVTVPAPHVLGALRDAESAGVKVAVVVSSGFEDRDSSLRHDLDGFARATEMRIIGPNCVGTLAVKTAAYLTFSSVLRTDIPRSGPIGLVTQSGALGNSLLQTLIRRHVGISQWVSTGDEVNVGAMEVVTGLLRGPDVSAVGVFLEGITDLDWLTPLAAELDRSGKRLIVLKAANTDAGRAAAAGHTGRVVGSSVASRAVLRDLGAHEVPTVSALADALVVAGTNPAVTGLVGPRLGLVSISGAAGVIGSDRVAQHPDLRVAHLDEDARRTLGERLDERLVPANPIDVPFIDDTRPFADALISFADSEAIDVVVGIESGLAHDRGVLRDRLVDLQEHSPIVLTSLSEDDQIPSAIVAELAAAGIPYLPTVDRAVDAIAACATRQAGEADIPVPVLEGDKEVQGLEWIRALVPDDFPWAQWRVIDDDADAETAAAEFGFPLALKAAGRTIVHRTEHGAVKVVRTPANLIGAYRSVAAVCAEHDDAVIAQAFAPTGFELLVSALRDPEVGPVAIVRPGGTFAEMMSAQAVIWGGWAPERRRANLRSSSLWELLDGYRGGERYDTEAVLDLVDRALDLVASTISFIEMNPAVASASGVYVVDCIARK